MTKLAALHCNGYACSKTCRQSLICLIAHRPKSQAVEIPKSACHIPTHIAFWPEGHTTSPHRAPQEHHSLHTADFRYISRLSYDQVSSSEMPSRLTDLKVWIQSRYHRDLPALITTHPSIHCAVVFSLHIFDDICLCSACEYSKPGILLRLLQSAVCFRSYASRKLRG